MYDTVMDLSLYICINGLGINFSFQPDWFHTQLYIVLSCGNITQMLNFYSRVSSVWNVYITILLSYSMMLCMYAVVLYSRSYLASSIVGTLFYSLNVT